MTQMGVFAANPLTELCKRLRELAPSLDGKTDWPMEQVRLCREQGVLGWFAPIEYGGTGLNGRQVAQGLLQLAAACQTTTFVLTQLAAAIRRISTSENEELKANWLSPLARGERYATVGISHLTTSRRHLANPVMQAQRQEHGYLLRGYSPWVTGAAHVDLIVTGAHLSADRQVLLLVPTDARGVSCDPPEQLMGLGGSCTSRVRFADVEVPDSSVLAGPAESVTPPGAGGQTGGLQTSTLALGLAQAACEYLEQEQLKRPTLEIPASSLRGELEELTQRLYSLAEGTPGSIERLRARSNSLVLRATQAALASAKGSGYILGHPAGRWCREALFFLVWSCPQAVVDANLCELAGIED